MISRISRTSDTTGRTSNFKQYIAAFAGLLAVGSLFAPTQANADRVVFRSNGGRWSRSYHSGWHRYWGGPSMGYYYAPAPVYVVPGYSRASYYSGPDFWYSNPSFGLNINVGGGRTYYNRPHYYNRPVRVYRNTHYNNHYNGRTHWRR